MGLNRHQRRYIAKMNNLKNIPSIKNVTITKLENPNEPDIQ